MIRKGQASLFIAIAIIVIVLVSLGFLGYVLMTESQVNQAYHEAEATRIQREGQQLYVKEVVFPNGTVDYLNVTNDGEVMVKVVNVIYVYGSMFMLNGENITLPPGDSVTISFSQKYLSSGEFIVVTSLGRAFST